MQKVKFFLSWEQSEDIRNRAEPNFSAILKEFFGDDVTLVNDLISITETG